MHAKRLPTILELLEKDVSKSSGITPMSECKMGWCTQCSCNKSDVEKAFGPTVYKSEPTIPPVSGKVLPCISTQRKETEEFERVKMLFDFKPTTLVTKKGAIYARLAAGDEVGAMLKTLVVVNGRLVVGQRETINSDSVILRNPKQLAPGKYSEMLVSLDKFRKTYGDVVLSSEFQPYSNSKPVKAFKITNEVAQAWHKDPDGRMYYQNKKEVVEVFVGSIITENGVPITDEIAAKLEISTINNAQLKSAIAHKPS